jgi:hypothetical protein
MTGSVPLGILGCEVPVGSHICAFYSGAGERDEIVLPFLAEGLRTGQKCIGVVESLTPADVVAGLGSSGVDAGGSLESGQLELATPAGAYFSSGRFSTDDIVAFWGAGVSAVKTSGTFSFIRATGEMPSVMDHPDGRTEFFRFETRLNEFASSFPLVVLCLYDLQQFGAEVLMEALHTHPAVIVDGMIHENPYYIEPSKFLARARAS